jgi:hypothetical protein
VAKAVEDPLFTKDVVRGNQISDQDGIAARIL